VRLRVELSTATLSGSYHRPGELRTAESGRFERHPEGPLVFKAKTARLSASALHGACNVAPASEDVALRQLCCAPQHSGERRARSPTRRLIRFRSDSRPRLVHSPLSSRECMSHDAQ